MQQIPKTKICLVGDSLSGGGAERVHAFLSQYFHQQGIEVHNVIVQDKADYQFSGELLNLGLLKDNANGFSNKLKRFKVLRNYIKTQQFDYIIDFRMRRKYIQDWLISKFVYTAPAIYTIHSSVLEWYLPKNPWFARNIYGNAYGVVSITNKIQELLKNHYKLTNAVTIYNPIDIAYIEKKSEEPAEVEYPYILAAGSMPETNIKKFDKLIEAYAASVLPDNDIRLVILGEGSRREYLEQLARKTGFGDKIIFKGFQENPYVYMRNALFYTLTSKNEGLPMVLLESLACGTPVVSFDCFTGPSEIIANEVNGLLIEDGNIDKFTEGINRMFEDKALYNTCKENAARSIIKFSLPEIGRQWMDYLKIQI